MSTIFSIVITSILIENIVLVKFLGICSFIGVSKRTDTALGMGMAVTFVMAIASAVTWCVQTYLLVPFHLEYLQTISFILVIAALVQLVEMAIQKLSPSLYTSLGIYLPLITTNCAVLGIAILNIDKNYNFIEALVSGVAAALSFTIAIFLFAGVRERLENSEIPEWMKGFPIALVTAGIIAMAFLGFQGLKI
ncbi:electron transport complex subunit RsxA [Acetivibrio sp. MSJd-27]|uniref:electron transport complex subunit RsxA n=1 Tax=Acetivibrio sp. MSJd-27 TaxID=2841523 RepID=UPI001C0FD361|nr:electron transport complex subunit RsxA [Acetivibrio sp. MSJd-27]MBU5450768.1 electron transport complex subunit RsxA [Acetivibrio sp. MSJd-27]